MGKIFTQTQTIEFSGDLIEFNKLLKENENELEAFIFEVYGQKVQVFIGTGLIEVNDKCYYTHESTTEKKRWISFRRVKFDFNMAGEKSNETITYGFGWQCKGKKRIVLIDKERCIKADG